jgi:hypothetical protein
MAAVKTPRFFSTTVGGDVAVTPFEDVFCAWLGTLLPEDDVAALGDLESVEPIMKSGTNCGRNCGRQEGSSTGRV